MTGPEARGAAEGLGGTIRYVPEHNMPDKHISTAQMLARIGLASVVVCSTAFTVQQARSIVATCEGASESEIQTVTNDLATAEQQHITEPEITTSTNGTIRTVSYIFGKEAAVFHQPEITPQEGYKLTGQQLLDYTIDFARSYNITLSVMTEADRQEVEAPDVSIMDSEQLDSLTTKEGLLAIMDGLAGLPESYVRASNIEHMYIIGDQPRLSAAAQPYGEHDIILFNLGAPLDANTVGHELTHSWDRWTGCGTTRKQLQDPQYMRHNHDDIYNPSMTDSIELPYSLDALLSETARGSKYMQAASMNPIIRRKLISQIEVVSDYSYTNPAEDKAEMMSAIVYDTSHGLLYSNTVPRLRSKAIELLARIRTTCASLYDYVMYRYEQDIANLGD